MYAPTKLEKRRLDIGKNPHLERKYNEVIIPKSHRVDEWIYRGDTVLSGTESLGEIEGTAISGHPSYTRVKETSIGDVSMVTGDGGTGTKNLCVRR